MEVDIEYQYNHPNKYRSTNYI